MHFTTCFDETQNNLESIESIEPIQYFKNFLKEEL